MSDSIEDSIGTMEAAVELGLRRRDDRLMAVARAAKAYWEHGYTGLEFAQAIEVALAAIPAAAWEKSWDDERAELEQRVEADKAELERLRAVARAARELCDRCPAVNQDDVRRALGDVPVAREKSSSKLVWTDWPTQGGPHYWLCVEGAGKWGVCKAFEEPGSIIVGVFPGERYYYPGSRESIGYRFAPVPKPELT